MAKSSLGLTDVPKAINAVFPKTKIQLCIMHMVRNSLKYVFYKDRKEAAKDLKAIYTSITLDVAERELNNFLKKWDGQ